MNQYAGPAPEARLHAFRDDALGDHDATALADLSDIQRDAQALELYLQDRHDHQEHCPELAWEQPKLDTYKDHEVRRALEPLASLADDTGVSILGNGRKKEN